jgi:hypothetical protein
MMADLPADVRAYLQAQHDLLEATRMPKDWPVLEVLSSLERLLVVPSLDAVAHETDHLANRAAVIKRARAKEKEVEMPDFPRGESETLGGGSIWPWR